MQPNGLVLANPVNAALSRPGQAAGRSGGVRQPANPVLVVGREASRRLSHPYNVTDLSGLGEKVGE
jgi:hypothetical protein